MGIYELNEASAIIKEEVDPEANIIVGAVINPVMSEEMMVTVIATGFDEEGIRERRKAAGEPEGVHEGHGRPKRKQEAFDFKNEVLGIDDEDLDKPTFLQKAGGLTALRAKFGINVSIEKYGFLDYNYRTLKLCQKPFMR